MTRVTTKTFTLPSFAAPGFRRMKMARATTSTTAAAAAAVVVVVTNLARGGKVVVELMKKPFAWVSKGALGTKLACPGAQGCLP